MKVRGEAELGSGEYVSDDYFKALGVSPAAGRLIANDGDRAGASPVAVVSFAYSQKRFGDPSKAVGATIALNNAPFTVIGVTAPDFFGIEPAEAPDVYVPIHALFSAGAFLDQHPYWLQMMARLRPGVNQSQAQAAVAAMLTIAVLIFLIGTEVRARLEDSLLLSRFGGSLRDYKNHTAGYIPLLR